MKNTNKSIMYFLYCIALIGLVISTGEKYADFLAQLDSVNKSDFFILIGGLIGSIFTAILQNFPFVIIFIAILFATRKYNRKKLDETDFEKNKNYYRDIVKNYSVSELNYIDKFKLDKRQSYTAKLLELENKKIIKIEHRKINIIGEAKDSVDQAFVESIKNNKVTMSLDEYEQLVISESLEKGLIEKPNGLDMFKGIKGIIFIVAIFVVFFVFIFALAFGGNLGEFIESYFLLFILSFFATDFIFVFGFAYFFTYIFKSSSDPIYRRTKKGKEINTQLDGLKLFMEEFSNISDKEAKHLVLWEDYLIYSVMFDINKKIQDDYSKYFD